MIDNIKFKTEPKQFVDGKPIFLENANFKNFQEELGKGLINKLKKFYKNFPWLYDFLFFVLNPALFLGKSPQSIYQFMNKDAIVAEIGSGSKRLHHNIINVDIYPWKEIDVVADAQDLPFADGSLDGVVSAWTVEHLKNPEKAVAEAYRALKPGGHIFLSTNFVYPYHPSPNDYYRWSREGLLNLLSKFEVVEFKVAVGPTSAFLAVLQEWLAILLSFNISKLKDIIWIMFVILTFPIKFLDLILVHYKTGESIAGGFYYVGKKND